MMNEEKIFEDINNEDKLKDAWLNENLNLLVVNPSNDFTNNVLEQLEIKPKKLWDSSIFWIIISILGIPMIVGLTFSIGSIFHIFNYDSLISLKSIPILKINQYLIGLLLVGLILIAFDNTIGKRFPIRTFLFFF